MQRRIFFILILALLIGVGFYLFKKEKNEVLGNRGLPADWTPEMRSGLIAECMEAVSESAAQYPDIVESYCDCSADTVMNAMTYAQYVEYSKLSPEEQEEIFRPLSEDCQMFARLQMYELREKEGQ
ncbi:MAG: hypothetical protein JJU02_06410 [Cryomorphaceae bacterium]|nr:hypothetical protein [Cryomorphaceae bacterium]